jgi:hypothetical protein
MAVKFANSNPQLVAFFCRWLRHFFEIDETRLRVILYLHEELDLPASTTHWSQVTGIPPEQFSRPYRAPADTSVRRTKHVHGCAHVGYSCSVTQRRILTLTEAMLVGVPGGEA